MKKQTVYFFLIISLLLRCREPYDPALEDNISSYLIVEGMINANGVTTIELGRTIRLSEKQVRQFELGAKVEIEGDNDTRFALTDKGAGVYTSASNVLARDRMYRLRIKTSAGKEYLSGFVAVQITQPVTASWSQDAEGVKVTASTADPSKQALYYHWRTEETWEIISPLPSLWVVVRNGGNITPAERNFADIVGAKQCWTTIRSGNILTASVASMAGGQISGFPLADIPNGSDKLATRYSMLVTQYAISREAYEFFELMKKNTETMGSLFDPNPSQIRGNITSTTHPGEIVVGFVDCSVSSNNRIFITSAEANNWKSSRVCVTTYVQNSRPDVRTAFATDATMISVPIFNEQNDIPPIGFNVAPAACVDCRVLGNNVKPSFW